MSASFPTFDVDQVNISQFANSPKVSALISDFNAWFDTSPNLLQFYNLVWNILTAKGFGLDIWGRILGVTRNITLSGTGTYFGFVNDGAGDFTGFGQAPFYSGATDTTTYTLSDTQYLPVLLAKALANISVCTAPLLNQLLAILFAGYGPVWTQDNGNMSMSYVFSFTPTNVQEAMVTQLGILPHPDGVAVNIVIV
jgi:hypothetical protein